MAGCGIYFTRILRWVFVLSAFQEGLAVWLVYAEGLAMSCIVCLQGQLWDTRMRLDIWLSVQLSLDGRMSMVKINGH